MTLTLKPNQEISLFELGQNIFQIGKDAEHQVYWTRVSLIIPVLQESFKNNSQIDAIIESLITASNHGKLPFFQYLIRAIELIETADTEDIPISFLAQSQIEFIINNLEKFKEIIRYLVIGNRRIEKQINDELYASAANQSLYVCQAIFKDTLALELDPKIR